MSPSLSPRLRGIKGPSTAKQSPQNCLVHSTSNFTTELNIRAVPSTYHSTPSSDPLRKLTYCPRHDAFLCHRFCYRSCLWRFRHGWWIQTRTSNSWVYSTMIVSSSHLVFAFTHPVFRRDHRSPRERHGARSTRRDDRVRGASDPRCACTAQRRVSTLRQVLIALSPMN